MGKTVLEKYVFSMDHKMISKQFMFTAIFMAFASGLISVLFRLQLAWPGHRFAILHYFLGDKWAVDGILDPNMYLSLITIHGTIMIFFLLTGGLTGTFANLLIPLQIGARDMASPLLNMLSYWFFFVSSVIMLSSLFVESGPASAGWSMYPPLSVLPQTLQGSGSGMTLWLISMILFSISSLLGGLNYIVTIFNLRTVGMKMMRLPLTIWAFLVTATLAVLSFPVLIGGLILLIFDRSFGTSFYLSDIYIDGQALSQTGGSPILFEHLFWFLGHPEVYIVIMPAFGIMSEVISVNSRKPIFGYNAMIGSMISIGFLSFLVWGHHMFVSGMDPFLGSVFVFSTLLIAIPSSVKVFSYIATLRKSSIDFNPQILFAIGAVSTFISGGLTGIILADSALNIAVHGTYFIVAHFHIVMGVSAVMAMFSGVYHWFPKMFGRMLNKKLGYWHFWLTFICAYCVFLPMHFLGLAGIPRRFYAFTAYAPWAKLQDINVLITVAAIIGVSAQIVFFVNFFYNAMYGEPSCENPWKSNTLEWTTEIIPVHGNWQGSLPVIQRWAYDYSKPGKENDYVPQTVPLEPGELDEGMFEGEINSENRA
ncbi:MAG TPA: cbb3-type cytochrome c oxidase subunit I [Bacteroidia bacterium]|nr:cbb3-type cytochrome c oxidase subunit I [Bacteroidia bacterium]